MTKIFQKNPLCSQKLGSQVHISCMCVHMVVMLGWWQSNGPSPRWQIEPSDGQVLSIMFSQC
jgi:hypothetical protein